MYKKLSQRINKKLIILIASREGVAGWGQGQEGDFFLQTILCFLNFELYNWVIYSKISTFEKNLEKVTYQVQKLRNTHPKL